MAATAQGTLNIEGVTFSKNTQEDVNAIADNRTNAVIGNSFDKSKDINKQIRHWNFEALSKDFDFKKFLPFN